MSARQKLARSVPSKRTPPKPEWPTATARQKLPMPASTEKILDECIAAVSLVEVTVHSLESREMASSEQEVLKHALAALWAVHDWINDLKLDDRGAHLRSRD